MPASTRKDVIAVFGDLDDVAVADIIATSATPDELAEAHAWLANDEALMNVGKHLPSGRLGRVVEILATELEEDQQREAPVPG